MNARDIFAYVCITPKYADAFLELDNSKADFNAYYRLINRLCKEQLTDKVGRKIKKYACVYKRKDRIEAAARLYGLPGGERKAQARAWRASKL